MSYKWRRIWVARIVKHWPRSQFRPDWMIKKMTRKQRRMLGIK